MILQERMIELNDKNKAIKKRMDIYKRYKEGEPISMIAQDYGVSKKWIYCMAKNIATENGRFTKGEMDSINKIRFKAVREWLVKNGVDRVDFREIMEEKYHGTPSSLKRFLETPNISSLYMICAILDVTGLTFEEAFSEIIKGYACKEDIDNGDRCEQLCEDEEDG